MHGFEYTLVCDMRTIQAGCLARWSSQFCQARSFETSYVLALCTRLEWVSLPVSRDHAVMIDAFTYREDTSISNPLCPNHPGRDQHNPAFQHIEEQFLERGLSQ